MPDQASQQTALAELARRALEGTDLDELLQLAAERVASELEADHVAVLERTRDGKGMLARSGVGLPDGVLGGVLPPDPEQLAELHPLQRAYGQVGHGGLLAWAKGHRRS